MKALVLAVALVLLPTLLDAGTLMRIRVLHEVVRGVPQQLITVFFWPAPEDRMLQVEAEDPDVTRSSSIRLYGIESQRSYTFLWRLPATRIRDEVVEPYTVTAATADADGHITGQAVTKFFVRR